MSRYYLDDADVESQTAAVRGVRGRGAADARRAACRSRRTSTCCKCSHTFNVLDSRGAVSTDRAGQGVRPDAPAGPRGGPAVGRAPRPSSSHPLGRSPSCPPRCRRRPTFPAVTGTRQLLFEIGTEEMPPREVTKTAEAVRDGADREAGRDPARPRRHHDVRDARAGSSPSSPTSQAREPDAERVVRGPRKSAAFDADGNADEGRRRVRPRSGRRHRAVARPGRRRRRVRRRDQADAGSRRRPRC